jgi:hypothetical protein
MHSSGARFGLRHKTELLNRSTVDRVVSLTLAESFSTRDTVAMLTPAFWATS